MQSIFEIDKLPSQSTYSRFFHKFNLKPVDLLYIFNTNVQALKSLGKEYISDEVIEKIKEQIEPKMYEKILKDTQSTTSIRIFLVKSIQNT